MRKIYSLLLILICVCLNVNAQWYDLIYDSEHLNIINQNHAMRLLSEKQFQNSQSDMKKKLDKINENFLKVIAAKKMVEESLFNVNSGLKNARSVHNISDLVIDITKNISKLSSVCSKHPEYSFVSKKYIIYAVNEVTALQKEVTEFALSGKKNIMMNYHQRDGVLRDVQIRLSLINSNLILSRRSIERAISLGFIKGATPFGDWISRDEYLVRNIINRSKYL